MQYKEAFDAVSIIQKITLSGTEAAGQAQIGVTYTFIGDVCAPASIRNNKSKIMDPMKLLKEAATVKYISANQ